MIKRRSGSKDYRQMHRSPAFSTPPIIGLIFFLMLAPSTTHSQSIDVFEKGFLEFTGKRPQEKLYLQTDKSFYVAGELLWFSLYLVDASSHKPIDLSKVAYVELLDLNNKPVAEAKIEMIASRGNGSIPLPAKIFSGNYRLRAYTNWMKNFDASLFFERTITIVNTQLAGSSTISSKPTAHQIRFFPEGGQLINGIQSRIAFQATGTDGNGESFLGALINANNDTLTRFIPSQYGIGSFNFMANGNERIRSVIKYPDGSISVEPFLEPVNEGYTLSVTQKNGEEITIHLETNIKNSQQVYLLAHARQSLKFIMAVPLSDGKAVLQRSLNDLGDGINHFTVFNSLRQPVAERLFFKMPARRLQISISPSSTELKSREEVKLNVDSRVNAVDVSAAMSLSVYRIDSLQGLPEQDIESYLMLSSDLRGTIESPAAYFKLPEPQRSIAIDELMLTHGWSRFTWQEISNHDQASFDYPPEYNGQLVTVKLNDMTSGKALAEREGYLSVPGIQNIFSTSTSDKNGKLRFEIQKQYGPTEMILQAKPQKDSGVLLTLENSFSTKFNPAPLPPFSLPVNAPNSLLEHHIGIQVQNVFTGEQLRKISAPPPDSASFYGNAPFKYMLDDYTRFKTIEEILREYVKLVFLRKRGGSYYVQVYDEQAKKTLDADPLVLIDGVPVFDFDKMMTVDPLKIRKLEVINNKYIFGNSVFDGILHWMSYDHDLAGYELDPRAVSVNYEGLQLKREFYSPVYHSPDATKTHLPDFRNVLYWSPDMMSKRKEKTEVHFFTSDLPGRYAIVVEGVTASGACGSAVSLFEVKGR